MWPAGHLQAAGERGGLGKSVELPSAARELDLPAPALGYRSRSDEVLKRPPKESVAKCSTEAMGDGTPSTCDR